MHLDQSLHVGTDMGMNMNSLIIATDASRARLFRTARTNVAEEPVELIEVDVIDAREACVQAPDDDEGSLARRGSGHDDVKVRHFAMEITDRVARFAQHHFCNPVILVAVDEVSSAVLTELEHKLSNVYIHQIIGETARLPASALLSELSEREAFSSPQARVPGTIEL
jgi:protein required for attachment to host cells